MHVPIIDISALDSSNPALRTRALTELAVACREVGFFGIVGHGIPRDLIADVFAASRTFFTLPIEAKLALRGDMLATNRGYVPLGGERLSADLPPDQKEAYNVGPEVGRDEPQAPWPDLPGWRETLRAYFSACHGLGRRLHCALAQTLGIREEFFEASLENPAAVLRLLHYPGGGVGPSSAGAGEHTDYGNITILATDGVAGLQVQDRTGHWIDMAGVEGGFICNIGDCLMRWSNAVFVSTPHRVVAPAAERYSIAFFLDPDPAAMVEPILTPGAPEPLFLPILAGDYIQSKLAPTYSHLAAGAMSVEGEKP